MIPAGARVLVAAKPVDFRKGPLGLMALVRESGGDPHAWLKLPLQRIADGWPNRDIDALMSWHHQRQS